MSLKTLYPLFRVFAFIILIQGCTEPQTPNFYLGGIQVNEPDQKQWMSVLKDVGMNTVSITIYGRHGLWNEQFMMWEKEEQENVIHEIKTAKQKGMHVVLIPRMLLDHYYSPNRFLWHGMIMPETDSLIQDWFSQYRSYVAEWATIAEKYDVDILGIGSELRKIVQTVPIDTIGVLEEYYLNKNRQKEYIADLMAYQEQIPNRHLWIRGEDISYEALEEYLQEEVAAKEQWAKAITFNGSDRPIEKINQRRALLLDEWTKLIDTVRTIYNGQLTYAANFDNYKNIAFWDQLDFMGINAYFKLRTDLSPKNNDELYVEMLKNWDKVFNEMKHFQLQDSIQKPVIFTELGYIRKEQCTIMPWQGFGFSIAKDSLNEQLIIWDEQEDKLIERSLAIKSLHDSNKKHRLLKGLLYWKLSSYSPHKEIEPFVMILNESDPMQQELVNFMQDTFVVDSYNAPL